MTDHETKALSFIGRRVSFIGSSGSPLAGKNLVGIVEAATYAGKTERGSIPDYALTVRGASGNTTEISLVENYASIE